MKHLKLYEEFGGNFEKEINSVLHVLIEDFGLTPKRRYSGNGDIFYIFDSGITPFDDEVLKECKRVGFKLKGYGLVTSIVIKKRDDADALGMIDTNFDNYVDINLNKEAPVALSEMMQDNYIMYSLKIDKII